MITGKTYIGQIPSYLAYVIGKEFEFDESFWKPISDKERSRSFQLFPIWGTEVIKQRHGGKRKNERHRYFIVTRNPKSFKKIKEELSTKCNLNKSKYCINWLPVELIRIDNYEQGQQKIKELEETA
jgi:hypothetical protein